MKRIMVLTIAAFMMFFCGSTPSKKQVDTIADDVTQVLYFHGKQCRITCNGLR